MIESLRIRNLGVIEDATVSLGPGLTAITGETGAGKTMLLTGVNLVRGRKVDAQVVRQGAAASDVESHWVMSGARAESIRAVIEDAGGVVEVDDDGAEILLSRTVPVEGRARGFAGGRAVPASVLEEISSELITVHGQSDQGLLRSATKQRELLDRFGGDGIESAIASFASDLSQWRAARDELAARRADASAWQAELALLQVGLARVDEVAPLSGEDLDVDRRLAILAHAGSLLSDASEAEAYLRGDENSVALESAGARSQLIKALRALEHAQSQDPSLEVLRDRVLAAVADIDDISHELSSYLADLEADPAQQDRLEQRRADLTALKRAYGPTLDDVLAWAVAARGRIEAAEGSDVESLAARVSELAEATEQSAAVLTEVRTRAAERLSAAITGELEHLALGGAVMRVVVRTSPDIEEWTSSGADTVDFMLAANRGIDERPLAKTASGGELSRIMLAIEVVLAGVDPVPTFVFDEVDAGVGGRAAVEIGKRLARLAVTSQVLVVTHLPQVAAFADRHIVVRKQDAGQVTNSDVTVVTGDDRVAELVRMMAGLEASESGAAHARELLALADAARASESAALPHR